MNHAGLVEEHYNSESPDDHDGSPQEESYALVTGLAQAAKSLLPRGPTGYPVSIRRHVTASYAICLRVFGPTCEYTIKVEQLRSAVKQHRASPST